MQINVFVYRRKRMRETGCREIKKLHVNIDKKKRYIVYLVSQNALQDLIADSYQKIGKDFLLTQYIVSKYIFIHVVYFIETDIFLFSLLLYLVVPFKLLLDILKFQNVISPRRPRL